MLRIDHIGLAARDAQASARALAEILHAEHVAFKVDEARFGEIVARLRARGVAFGNDPENVRNGRTDDPLGGAGRVYWADENGHLFEATC